MRGHGILGVRFSPSAPASATTEEPFMSQDPSSNSRRQFLAASSVLGAAGA
ncbi:twin-arginine translocation signal domain-containing protein, partial [Pseudomonas sp. MAHUQ-62]|uniref:twin-arginine translocation signal domain-containing protein n=1 Tax=Pseudomonas sp. GCM10023245 TaxID=3252652 RepID=UPI00360C2EBD